MTAPELTRPVSVTFREDGCVEGITCLSPTEFKIRAEVQTPPSRVIPVIVVPGIMGSNLRKIADHNVKVWRPPNGGWEKAKAGFSGGWTGAASRQRAFAPDEAEVDPEGPVSVPMGTPWLNEREASDERGWGSIHLDSYGDLLVYLETHLNQVFTNKQLQSEWAQMQKHQDATGWGAQKPKDFEAVTQDDLKLLPRAFYPVYAVGYNWLQSNNQSAATLKTRIEEIIARWSKARTCNQVLLVTHSMGGLVARRCTQLIPDKILGVMHGVLPSLGAAATYKRMRAGFEGKESMVLGWNEAEATASLANAPGPLELLPQAAYNGGKPWLHVCAGEPYGGTYASHELPLKDAYAEIYEKDAKTCWYGLVNSDLIDPAGVYKNKTKGKVPWDAYLDNLNIVRKFHEQIGNHYHAHTRAYYGADQDQRAWGEARWKTYDMKPQDIGNLLMGEGPDSNGTGKIKVRFKDIKATFAISPQDALGDGTVPADASGHDPATSPNVQQCYRMTGFDHQHSYNNSQVRLAVLHSLVKLAQRSPLLMKA